MYSHILTIFFISHLTFASPNDFIEMLNLEKNQEVSCEELSDKYCEYLWSAERLGNITLPTGDKILKGYRRNKFMRHAEFIHLKKIVKNQCFFPDDLKQELDIDCSQDKKVFFNELDVLLDQIDIIPIDAQKVFLWKEKIASIKENFKNAIVNVSFKRTYKKLPYLKSKLWGDYSYTEYRAYYESHYDIKNQIMDAVYLKDPNWIFAKKVFIKAKEDALKVVENLKISKQHKRKMREKILDTQISLPYRDPRRTDADQACAYDENNGIYKRSSNILYLCLGKINTVANFGSLYGTISHEIAHAIDPETYSVDEFYRTRLARETVKVFERNASLPCQEWKRIKDLAYTIPKKLYNLPKNIEKLSQCLVDRSRLDPITMKSLDYASKRTSEKSVDRYATKKALTFLTIPQNFKDGVLVENEVYLNPKPFSSSGDLYLPTSYYLRGGFHFPSIFIQDYKCRLSKTNDEKKSFKDAIEETIRLRKIYNHNTFSFSKQNSYQLTSYNLAKTVAEDFADWMSHKAFVMALKKFKSLTARRALILGRHSTFCSRGGIERVAKEKVKIEKKYSRAEHPLARKRRLRYFTPEIAQLVQCKRGIEVKNLDQGCDSLIID